MGEIAAGIESRVEPVEREVELRSGGERLYVRSLVPGGGERPWARLVLLHGYGEHAGRHLHFLRWLAARGVACRTFDFRGQGRSSGRRGYVRRWEEYLDDAGAVLAAEEREAMEPVPRFLLGHSHGGLVAVLGLIRGVLRADACILSAPYLRNRVPVSRGKFLLGQLLDRVVPWCRIPSGMGADWMTSDPAMIADAEADPLLLHSATPRWYLRMLDAQAEALRRAPEFRVPVLCLTGDADPVADSAAAAEFVADAGSADKSLLRYAGLKHELLRETERERIFADVLAWMRGRIPPAERAAG